MKRIFRVEYFSTLSLELLVIIGIVVCGIYKETPNVVELASLLALGGLFGLKAFNHAQNAEKRKLEEAEASERAYLDAILMRVEQGQGVDSAIVKRAKQLRSEADEIYKSLYGFYRPAPAISIRRSASAAAEQAKQTE